MNMQTIGLIKAIIGLGNPGRRFDGTRHNIGFAVLDALAENYNATWHEGANLLYAELMIDDHKIWLIKPQTGMNVSGKALSFLLKKGIKPAEMLVVHDELEQPFGKVGLKFGGSAKGHNGLRSIMGVIGKDFPRLRMGIGRPENRDEVGDYVLSRFSEHQNDVQQMVDKAVAIIEENVKSQAE